MKIEMPVIPDLLPPHAIVDLEAALSSDNPRLYQEQTAQNTAQQRQCLVSHINDLCDCCDV